MHYKAFIPCSKLSPSVLSDDTAALSVEIKNFEVIQGGYFSQTFVLFEVKTSP